MGALELLGNRRKTLGRSLTSSLLALNTLIADCHAPIRRVIHVRVSSTSLMFEKCLDNVLE